MDVPNDDKASRLISVINKVKALRPIPPVYIYNVKTQHKGLIAVDIDEHCSHLAYSVGHSNNICLLKWANLGDDGPENFEDEFERRCQNMKYSSEYENFINSKNRQNKCQSGATPKSSRSSRIHVLKQSADITHLHFTPNSNLLLSRSLDGIINAWSVNNLKLVESYHGTPVCFDIHVSSDSAFFATSSKLYRRDNGLLPYVACLYTFEKKEPVATFDGHTDNIECVRFHPSWRYIATASCDKTIKLWCTQTFKDVRCFKDEHPSQGHPEKLAFSPDGKYLAATYGGSVKIWDIQASKIIKCLKISNSRPRKLNLCYEASGKMLVTGGSNKKLHLWDVQSVDEKPEDKFLKCDTLHKTIHCIKYTTSFFSLVTSSKQ